jgi:hypothetical protein
MNYTTTIFPSLAKRGEGRFYLSQPFPTIKKSPLTPLFQRGALSTQFPVEALFLNRFDEYQQKKPLRYFILP